MSFFIENYTKEFEQNDDLNFCYVKLNCRVVNTLLI